MNRLDVHCAEHCGMWHVALAPEYIEFQILNLGAGPTIYINGGSAPESLMIHMTPDQFKKLAEIIKEYK